jgi:hypothetical protein
MKAIESGSLADVLAVKDVDRATEFQKIQLIRICNAQSLVPISAHAVRRLWGSFTDQLPAVASKYMPDWEQTLKGGRMAVLALAPIKTIADNFRSDIIARASANLFENREYVRKRQQLIGVPGGDARAPSKKELTALRQSIQAMAYHVWDLKQSQRQQRTIIVGETYSGNFSRPAEFDPERPPGSVSILTPPTASWRDVKDVWDEAADEISAIAAVYPEIYAALGTKDAEEQLLHLSRVVADKFDETAGALLIGLMLRIEEIQDLVNQEAIDALDMTPIHKQLYKGAGGVSGTNWQGLLEQSIAKHVVMQHGTNAESAKAFWNLGEFMALLVASFATGGFAFYVAAAAAVVIPAVEAGTAMSEADKLDKAAHAAPLQGSELVAQAQADEKKAEGEAKIVQAVTNALLLGVPLAAKGIQRLRMSRSLDGTLGAGGKGGALDALGTTSGGGPGGPYTTLVTGFETDSKMLETLLKDHPALEELQEQLRLLDTALIPDPGLGDHAVINFVRVLGPDGSSFVRAEIRYNPATARLNHAWHEFNHLKDFVDKRVPAVYELHPSDELDFSRLKNKTLAELMEAGRDAGKGQSQKMLAEAIGKKEIADINNSLRDIEEFSWDASRGKLRRGRDDLEKGLILEQFEASWKIINRRVKTIDGLLQKSDLTARERQELANTLRQFVNSSFPELPGNFEPMVGGDFFAKVGLGQ